MLVIRSPDGRIRWMDVRAYLLRERTAGKEVKQIEFNGEPFTAASILALRKKRLGLS
jgi:hypothetical protein